jgi:hypothetical protein
MALANRGSGARGVDQKDLLQPDELPIQPIRREPGRFGHGCVGPRNLYSAFAEDGGAAAVHYHSAVSACPAGGLVVIACPCSGHFRSGLVEDP